MRRISPVLVAALALVAILVSVWRLEGATRGLSVERTSLGDIPLTVFRSAGDVRDAPVVVIAHGFAGSQQLMHPLAVTLARNGHVAVTFDFPGHGRNDIPMPGRGDDWDARQRVLADALDAVGDHARRVLSADGRYAVLGHSMASDLIVRHAQSQPAVHATIALSAFAPTVRAGDPPDRPANLLVIVGALEPEALRREALRVTRPAEPERAEPGMTYGAFGDGTARRAAIAPGVEHIGVLYAAATLHEALDWVNRAFDADRGTQGAPFLDTRGPWLALLLGGLVALAWPLSKLLPRVGHRAAPTFSRRAFWTAALVPAVLTPLLLWPVPTGVLPVLLADYLVLHFALYGALTLVLTARARPQPMPDRDPARDARLGLLALAGTATAGYALLAIGVPLDRYVFNMQPAPGRWTSMLAMLVGTAPYFLADERLVRATGAPRFAGVITKACFLFSLAIAIALNLRELFFLIIIVPAILLLFVVSGLFSGWAWRQARHSAIPAIASAVAFAWFVGVTFPRVG